MCLVDVEQNKTIYYYEKLIRDLTDPRSRPVQVEEKIEE